MRLSDNNDDIFVFDFVRIVQFDRAIVIELKFLLGGRIFLNNIFNLQEQVQIV